MLVPMDSQVAGQLEALELVKGTKVKNHTGLHKRRHRKVSVASARERWAFYHADAFIRIVYANVNLILKNAKSKQGSAKRVKT